MKKILVLLISILMIISSFSISVFAENAAQLSLENITVKQGETVEMPVSISDNKGIWGLVFNICFDTNAFHVKEVRSTGDVFNKGDIMIGPADFNDGYVRVVVTPGDVMNNNTNNGTICTIILEQTENAKPASYPFTFQYETTDFCDVDANYVTVSSVDGKVDVVGENQDTTTAQNAENEANDEGAANNQQDSTDAENAASTVSKTNAQKATQGKQDKTTAKEESRDDLGDVIAKAENNKIIDDYNVENQNNAVQNNNSENKDDEIIDLNEQTNESAQAVSSTGNAMVLIYYIATILVLAGIVVLIVVLVKKFKKK